MRYSLDFDEKTQRWDITETAAECADSDIGKLHRTAPEFQAFPAASDGIEGRARGISVAALAKLSVWREVRTSL